MIIDVVDKYNDVVFFRTGHSLLRLRFVVLVSVVCAKQHLAILCTMDHIRWPVGSKAGPQSWYGPSKIQWVLMVRHHIPQYGHVLWVNRSHHPFSDQFSPASQDGCALPRAPRAIALAVGRSLKLSGRFPYPLLIRYTREIVGWTVLGIYSIFNDMAMIWQWYVYDMYMYIYR